MAFGSMAPGMPQLPIPNFTPPDPASQGMSILQAMLKAKTAGGPGAPGTPPLLGANGGIANMMGGGMGNGLLAKLFPQTPGVAPGGAPGPVGIDMSGGGGMPDLGGAGPAPTALTGLW